MIEVLKLIHKKEMIFNNIERKHRQPIEVAFIILQGKEWIELEENKKKLDSYYNSYHLLLTILLIVYCISYYIIIIIVM